MMVDPPAEEMTSSDEKLRGRARKALAEKRAEERDISYGGAERN